MTTRDHRTAILRLLPLPPGAGNRGVAYMIAVVTLLVGTVLGLAMLRASGGYFLAEQSRAKRMAALSLAEAGVDYATWQVNCNQARLPYSADVTLGQGSFHVDVTDDGSRDQSSMLITSRGMSDRCTRTVKRVMLGLLPYNYCWCENAGVSDGDVLITSTAGRGIRSNGSISLTNASTNIQAGGWANTTFSGAGVITPKYAYTPKVRFPSLDLNYYASIATRTFGSPGFPVAVVLNNSHFLGGGGVIFVYGDVTSMQNITYSGTWIVVVTDDIDLNCPVRAADSNSYLALIAYDNIGISTSASAANDRLDAVVYAPYGAINLRGTNYSGIPDNAIYVNGSMSCNNFSTSGDGGPMTVNMNYDTRLTLQVLRDRLKLPGL